MWNRNPSIFWGIVLVVLGVLFLLSNLDININWSIVWPVVLIALGVWLLVARVGPGGASAGLDSAEARDGLTKAKLEVAVGSGRIDVRSTDLGDQLYRTHIEHAGTAPEVNLDRATGTVRISQRLDWFAGARRLRIDTQVSDAIPWEITCNTGAIRGDFNLSTTSRGRQVRRSRSRHREARYSSAGMGLTKTGAEAAIGAPPATTRRQTATT